MAHTENFDPTTNPPKPTVLHSSYISLNKVTGQFLVGLQACSCIESWKSLKHWKKLLTRKRDQTKTLEKHTIFDTCKFLFVWNFFKFITTFFMLYLTLFIQLPASTIHLLTHQVTYKTGKKNRNGKADFFKMAKARAFTLFYR